MNMKITITELERKSTIDLVFVDPCADIECSGIDCNCCPLREAANKLRQAQEQFCKVLNAIEIMG